jgi:NAD-dependent SIR2 family protein deacetylase
MTEFYRNETHKFGTLLKLHGSLNWLHCKTCNRLEIGASERNRYIKRVDNCCRKPAVRSTRRSRRTRRRGARVPRARRSCARC